MEFKKIPSNLQFKDHYSIFNKFNQLSKKDSISNKRCNNINKQ